MINVEQDRHQFIKTFNKHWRIILNYFNERVTSDFVEGFNNKIKVIKRRCDGIFNTEKLIVYQVIDNLQEYVLIAQDCKHLEVYQRNNAWQPEVFESSINFTLQSVDLVLSVDAVYV